MGKMRGPKSERAVERLPFQNRGTCSGAGLRILNREFRAVGSGAERAGQRVTGTLSALESANHLALALVRGTLEPGCLPLQD